MYVQPTTFVANALLLRLLLRWTGLCAVAELLGIGVAAVWYGAMKVWVGAVFGLVQSWALPAEATRRYLWVIGNALGWAVGLPLIYIGAQIAADQADWVSRITLWALGGVGAGTSVGVFTGLALLRMGWSRAERICQGSFYA